MIVLAAAALGETPTAWGRRHKLLVRGQPTISCTPGKTMQDGKECGSQIQQSLLLKKIAVIEPHNLRSKATCSTKYHKPFPEEHPFIILEKYIFSRVRYTLIFLYIQLTLQQTISVQEHSSHAIPN